MSPQLHIQFKDTNDEGSLITVSFEIVQALIEQNESLQQNLQILCRIDDEVPKSDVQHTINKAVTAANDLNRFISHLWKSCPPHFRPSKGPASKAVFQVPELLDRILSNLDARDLLAAQQTNVFFRNVIDGSPSIQKTLGLRPDRQSHFYSPFKSRSPLQTDSPYFGAVTGPLHPQIRPHNTSLEPFRGLDFCAEPHRQPPLAHLSNALSVTGRLDFMPTQVGRRCLRMLICQPPVKQVFVYMCKEGSNLGFDNTSHAGDIEREKGVTVGDVLGFARMVIEKRGLKQLGHHGLQTEWLELRFKIQPKYDDPIMEQRRRIQVEMESKRLYPYGRPYVPI